MTRMVVVGCFLLFLSGCSETSETKSADVTQGGPLENGSPDGRFGTPCTSWVPYGREMCQVSIYRLIATPERYDGKFVDIKGYLIDVGGGPMIFPSPDRLDVGVPGEAIEIVGKLPPEVEAEVRNGIWPVFAVGTFDAKYPGSIGPVLGALRDVERIAHIKQPLRSPPP